MPAFREFNRRHTVCTVAGMRNVVSLAAVFMFACSGAGDASFDEPTSAPENTANTAENTQPKALAATQAHDSLPPGTAWLVWGSDHAAGEEVDDDLDHPLIGDRRDANLDLRSFALDANGRVLATFDAALIAANGTVFRWETEQVDVQRSPCAQIDDPSGLPNETDEDREIAARLLADSEQEKRDLAEHPTTKVSRGSFVDETTHARTVVSELRADDLDGVRDVDFRALPLASVGSSVFVHDSEWTFACGAHGNWGSGAHVVDLVTMKSTDADALSFVDEAMIGSARAKAERAFAEDRAEWNGEPDKEPASLVELFPHYDKAGEVTLVARFLASAPYAFSHGWASYSMAALAPIEPMPAVLAEQAKAPPVVRDFVRAHGTFTMRGFSRAHP